MMHMNVNARTFDQFETSELCGSVGRAIPLKSVNDKYSEWHEEMTFITRYVCISFSFKRFESVWLSVLASVVPGSKYLYLT